MKKRVIGLTLVVCLLFSTTAFASSTSISQMSPDMNAAIEVATSYLEDAAYSQYFYDAQDLVAHTIEVIPENERQSFPRVSRNILRLDRPKLLYHMKIPALTPGHSRLLRKTWSCIGTVLPTMGILTS